MLRLLLFWLLLAARVRGEGARSAGAPPAPRRGGPLLSGREAEGGRGPPACIHDSASFRELRLGGRPAGPGAPPLEGLPELDATASGA